MSGELQPFELIYVPRGEESWNLKLLLDFSRWQKSFAFDFVLQDVCWQTVAGVPIYLSKRAHVVDEVMNV